MSDDSKLKQEPLAAQSSLRSRTRQVAALLAVLLVSGLVLRIWGVWFDLPYLAHPDESNEVHRALRLGVGSFEWERIGKGGYFYVLFVEYGVFFAVARVLGVYASSDEFMLQFVRDPTAFWLIGRTTTALLGTLNIWLTYRIGKRISGPALGLLAAFLLTFCSIHVLHSKFITVDIPMATCVLVTTLFSLRIAKAGKLRDYLLAGTFAALATMTKLTAAPIVVAIVLAHVTYHRNEPAWIRQCLLDRRIYLAALVCALVYVAGEPGILFNGGRVLQLVQGASMGSEPSVAIQAEPPNLIMFYALATKDSIGWGISILSILGLLCVAFRRRTEDLIWLSFPILLYLVLISCQKHHIRYLVCATPFLMLLAAQYLLLAFPRFGLSPRATGFATVFLVIALCIPRLHIILQNNLAYARPGTPLLAKHWIETQVPAGDKVLLIGFPGTCNERKICPIRDTAENMSRLADSFEDESPTAARFIRLAATEQGEPVYDLTAIDRNELWISLDEAKHHGIQYVVISVEDFTDHISAEKSGRQAFYHELKQDPHAVLCESFAPQWINDQDSSKRDRHLEIYKILSPDEVTSKQHSDINSSSLSF